jgi:type IV pilus assembly protein PilC
MKLAYAYTARNARGTTVKGLTYAANRAQAFGQLKVNRLQPVSVGFSLGGTISSTLHSGFNQAELSRFYLTLGRRMRNGRGLVEGLAAAVEYVNDNRLRQAILMMQQSISEGQDVGVAMRSSGFPDRDCKIVAATVDIGKTSETLISVGEEIARQEKLRNSVKATFRTPSIMAVFMAVFIWAALVFIAPRTLDFLQKTELKMHFNLILINYFRLVRVFNAQVVLWSIAYFGVLAGIFFFFKSGYFRRILDQFKTLKHLSMKADHASLWNSFVLLYDASVPVKEAAPVVAAAALREDSRRAFYALGKAVESGTTLEAAVVQGGLFPAFIVSGVISAASSGDVVTGLRDMVSNLTEDVEVLSSILKQNAELFSIFTTGLGVLVVFLMTYYPMMASVLSNT